MAKSKSVTIQLSKHHGAPQAVVYVAAKTKLADLQDALAGIYRDRRALKSVGLRFCDGCKSGLDILIRDRFAAQIDVQV